MIITDKTENAYPPSWINTPRKKNEYYSKGRVTVLRLECLKGGVRFCPRIAGVTFKPRNSDWMQTPEAAYQEGVAIRQEMRDSLAKKARK